MVAGLAFLSKKSFNPKNLSNQKTVWEAREAKKQEDRRLQERSQQLQREQEELELARVRHGDTGGDKASLGFMYAPPPGMAQDVKKEQASSSNSAAINTSSAPAALLHERQPGDDDAAAAFRAMLAGSASTTAAAADEHDDVLQFSNNAGAAMQGSTVERVLFAETDGRSALEKAVGRRNNNNGGTTLEEQVARFPQLKHAPMAKGLTKQSSSANVSVNFKPLGTQLRNVQCLACGIWGHSRNDRECSKSGWDPFASRGVSAAAPALKNATANVSISVASLLTRGKNGTTQETLPAKSEKRRAAASDDSSSSSSSSSDDEDSYERRKRRKRERKRRKRHRREKSERRKRRSHSARDDDYESDEERRYRKKKERRKKRRRYDSDSSS